MEVSGSLWTMSPRVRSPHGWEKGVFIWGGGFPWLQHVPDPHPNTGLLWEEPNPGFAALSYLGIEQSSGNYPNILQTKQISVVLSFGELQTGLGSKEIVSKIPNQGEQALSSTCCSLDKYTNLPNSTYFSEWAHISEEQNFSKQWLKSYTNHFNDLHLLGKLSPLGLNLPTGIQC